MRIASNFLLHSSHREEINESFTSVSPVHDLNSREPQGIGACPPHAMKKS